MFLTVDGKNIIILSVFTKLNKIKINKIKKIIYLFNLSFNLGNL